MPSKKKADNTVGGREAWLQKAAAAIGTEYHDVFAGYFGKEGLKHLSKIRVSAGFPSVKGLSAKNMRIGECWHAESAADGHHHIFISPLLEEPVKVLATLAHELVHAADNGEHQHRGVFTKAVRDLGLEGKPTATVPGEEFTAWARALVEEIGPYPHVGLVPTLKTKTQKTYMVKVVCPGCNCIVRMTQKWLDEAGAPFCGTRSHVDPETGRTTDRRMRMGVED